MSSSSRPSKTTLLTARWGSHSHAPAFLEEKGGWIGLATRGLWGACGKVCMAQGRAAAPRQEHVHNHLLRAVSLTLQEDKCCKSANPTYPFLHPHGLCVPPTPRAAEGDQQYSRQGSLAGNDAVGPVPFVHQPCVGLHPHPAAPLGQQPEHCQPTLPCLHHWGRHTREVPQTEFLHTGRQMCKMPRG